jgi:O-antigen ligase
MIKRIQSLFHPGTFLLYPRRWFVIIVTIPVVIGMGALVATNTTIAIGLLGAFGVGVYTWFSLKKPYAAFLILVFFALNESLSGVRVTGSISLMVVIGFVFALAWIMRLVTQRARFLGINEFWVLLALAGVLIASSIKNLGGPGGTRFFLTYIQQLLLVVLIINFVTSPEKLRTMGIVVILASLSIGLPMMLPLVFGISPYSLGMGVANEEGTMVPRLMGYFSDPNFTCAQLLLAVPFMVEIWPGLKSARGRLALLAAGAMILLAAYFTYSIGGEIALIIYLLVKIVFLTRQNLFVKTRLILIFTIIGVIIYFVFFPKLYQAKIQKNFDTVTSFLQTGSSSTFSQIGSSRGGAWQAAAAAIEASPVLGYGPGNGTYATTKFLSKPVFKQSPAHNMFLGITLDLGVIGTALILFLFLTSLAAVSPRRGQRENPHSPLIISNNAILGGLIICLVMGMSLDFNLLKFPWILIGMALASRRILKSYAKINGDV